MAQTPLLSVVIPAYNNPALLRMSLNSLAAQRFPRSDFEVVDADDASTDDLRTVAGSFAGRLRVRYHAQESRGYRAANRNAGAQAASAPLLAFIDQGVVTGPDFVRAYVDAHRAPGRRAFIGYAHGYDLAGPRPGLTELLAAMPPEEVVRHYDRTEPLHDMRHGTYAGVGFDLGRLHAPWALFWTVNVSCRRDDYWAVGGFDERFHAWGVEDVEFAYRLDRAGVRPALSREAWVIDGPHKRDMRKNRRGSFENAAIFWDRHRTLEAEMYWAVYGRWHGVELSLEEECAALHDWTRTAEPDVSAEVEHAGGDEPFAVIGCGASAPARPCTLVDFDATLLEKAAREGHRTVHALGVRTGLPDDAFATVLVTSRMTGLWPRWGEMILAEANRIGRDVRVLF
jgi:glycosyltransferase involved in cell wall biosynthesis